MRPITVVLLTAEGVQVLFAKALKPGGVFIIEDIETSFWAEAPKVAPEASLQCC